MKTKTIFLCASMNFYKELVGIEQQLIDRGFLVHIPVSAKAMKVANDFEVSHFKGTYTPKQKGEFIRENFENIARSNAILVINNIKNGITGYIGPNVLMEIGLAYAYKQKIYIWNQYPTDAPYVEELLALNTIVIDQDLDKILL